MKFKEDNDDPIKDMKIGLEGQIRRWLTENKIVMNDDFIITSKYEINTYNTVKLANKDLTEIPDFLNFKNVLGGFECDHNQLISLRGTPKIVSGSFIASWNNLNNLNDGPKEVKGDYTVSHNHLTSLEGLASKIEGYLSVSNNNLKNLKGVPSVIHGSFFIQRNQINTLKYFPDMIEGDLFYTKTDMINEELIRNRCTVRGSIINKQ
jgi:hypothetical protein